MTYDPARHHRHSIRLRGYDYSQCGAYFITICTWDRSCLFGEVVGSDMCLNESGKVVADAWRWLGNQYNYVKLDQWVVMPNHLHGIIVIIDDDGRGGSRTTPTYDGRPVMIKRKPVGRLVGAFKTVSTKQINTILQKPGLPVWQRNYYEHIIRDEESLNRIRQYIIDNPRCWMSDDENPNKTNAKPEHVWPL